jgi:hypothetical protein
LDLLFETREIEMRENLNLIDVTVMNSRFKKEGKLKL